MFPPFVVIIMAPQTYLSNSNSTKIRNAIFIFISIIWNFILYSPSAVSPPITSIIIWNPSNTNKIYITDIISLWSYRTNKSTKSSYWKHITLNIPSFTITPLNDNYNHINASMSQVDYPILMLRRFMKPSSHTSRGFAQKLS